MLVWDTISLVEDRIAEILESGDLSIKLDDTGFLSDSYLDATRKFKFLKKLSIDLANFNIRRY